MISDIIDNRTERVTDRVRQLLGAGAVSAKFAVGYLFLEGLTPLRGQIDILSEMQLLIGNVENRVDENEVRGESEDRFHGQDTRLLEQVRDQEIVAHGPREMHSRISAVTALNLRQTLAETAKSPEMAELLLILARRIADGGLKVRLYGDEHIHAKLSMIRYGKESVAIVGSSNLTVNSPGHATELNVVVRNPESIKSLDSWFQDLWETSQDFHRELFEEIGQCWAMTYPTR